MTRYAVILVAALLIAGSLAAVFLTRDRPDDCTVLRIGADRATANIILERLREPALGPRDTVRLCITRSGS